MRGLCALRGVFISVLEALSEFCEHICIYAIHRAVQLDPVTLVCYITEAHENYRKVVQADSGKTGPSRVTSHVIHILYMNNVIHIRVTLFIYCISTYRIQQEYNVLQLKPRSVSPHPQTRSVVSIVLIYYPLANHS